MVTDETEIDPEEKKRLRLAGLDNAFGGGIPKPENTGVATPSLLDVTAPAPVTPVAATPAPTPPPASPEQPQGAYQSVSEQRYGAAQPAPVAAPVAPRETRFVNFDRVLNANKAVSEGAGMYASNAVGTSAANATNALGQVVKKGNDAIMAGTQFDSGSQLQDPNSAPGTPLGEGEISKEEAARRAGLTYGGPEDLTKLEGYTDAVSQLQNTKADANALVDQDARQAYLKMLYGQATAQDSALIGATSGGALQATAEKFGNIDKTLTDATEETKNKIEAAKLTSITTANKYGADLKAVETQEANLNAELDKDEANFQANAATITQDDINRAINYTAGPGARGVGSYSIAPTAISKDKREQQDVYASLTEEDLNTLRGFGGASDKVAFLKNRLSEIRDMKARVEETMTGADRERIRSETAGMNETRKRQYMDDFRATKMAEYRREQNRKKRQGRA